MHPAAPRRALAATAAALLATAAALAACTDAPTTPRNVSPPAAVIAAAPTTSNKADLTVVSVGHIPASPTTADLVMFTATVTNVGQNKVPRSFDVQFDFGTGTPEVVTVAGLAGGASAIVSSTPQLLAAGSYVTTVTADFGDRIKEGDETNNVATDAYVVAPVVTSNVITFEVDAAGNPICAIGCDVTTEFASRGVVFSYESVNTTLTNASICDGSRIDPPALVTAGNHEVTAPNPGYPCGGFATGVLVMTFSGAPTSVQMVLRSPETCTATPLSVTAVGADPTGISYTTTDRYLYNGTIWYALQRTAVVTNTSGISEIRVAEDGCQVYVDDLLITP